MDDIALRVGRRIREARLEMGWTQEQLAARLSTQKAEISRWECGTSSPSFKRLPAVAAALGVDVHALFAPDGFSTEQDSRRPEVAAFARYLRTRSPEEVRAIERIVRAIFAIRIRHVR